MQRSLLPQQLPDSPYLEFSAFSRPAQMIGGDYFDFFQFADGGQGLTIADVAGHGVPAALHMASIQALLRTLIPVNSSPKEVLSHIQRLLIHNVNFSNFVTIFLASFDHATHLLKYTNAGHTPPLLLRPNGAGLPFTDWLYPTGAAIGLIEELLMQEAVIAVQPGDVLVMVTDGVTEAMDASGEQFGYERLTQAASKAMEVHLERLSRRSARIYWNSQVRRTWKTTRPSWSVKSWADQPFIFKHGTFVLSRVGRRLFPSSNPDAFVKVFRELLIIVFSRLLEHLIFFTGYNKQPRMSSKINTS